MKRRRSIEAEVEMKWQQSSDGLNNPHTQYYSLTHDWMEEKICSKNIWSELTHDRAPCALSRTTILEMLFAIIFVFIRMRFLFSLFRIILHTHFFLSLSLLYFTFDNLTVGIFTLFAIVYGGACIQNGMERFCFTLCLQRDWIERMWKCDKRITLQHDHIFVHWSNVASATLQPKMTTNERRKKNAGRFSFA